MGQTGSGAPDYSSTTTLLKPSQPHTMWRPSPAAWHQPSFLIESSVDRHHANAKCEAGSPSPDRKSAITDFGTDRFMLRADTTSRLSSGRPCLSGAVRCDTAQEGGRKHAKGSAFWRSVGRYRDRLWKIRKSSETFCTVVLSNDDGKNSSKTFNRRNKNFKRASVDPRHRKTS